MFHRIDGNCFDEKDVLNAITSTSVLQRPRAECEAFYSAIPQTGNFPETSAQPVFFTSTSIPSSSPSTPSPNLQSPASATIAIAISASALVVIIAIIACLIMYRRRRKASLVNAQAEPLSSINLPHPTSTHNLLPDSISASVKPEGTLFSFYSKCEQEQSSLFTPLNLLHGDEPSSMVIATDPKLLATAKIPAEKDDSYAGDEKQGNLFPSMTITESMALSDTGAESGIILRIEEPAIQQSSTDLVMTNALSWSCQQVSSYLVNCGFDQPLVEKFQFAEMDGPKLLVLSHSELVEMGVIEEDTRVLVLIAIERLKLMQQSMDLNDDGVDEAGVEIPPQYS